LIDDQQADNRRRHGCHKGQAITEHFGVIANHMGVLVWVALRQKMSIW
jgi:hypothetical protein